MLEYKDSRKVLEKKEQLIEDQQNQIKKLKIMLE